MIDPLSDSQVRDLAKEIIRRPEFAGWRELDLSGFPWLAALRDWLLQLDDLFGSMVIQNPVLLWTIIYSLALLAVLLIAHLVWTIRVALRASPIEISGLKVETGTDFVRLAEELATAGRFLDAAHCLQLACIEQLLRRRLITLSRSEPNRTLRRRLTGSAVPLQEQGRLVRLIDQTETAWFRDRSQDPVLYDGWRQMHSRLTSLQAPAT